MGQSAHIKQGEEGLRYVKAVLREEYPNMNPEWLDKAKNERKGGGRMNEQKLDSHFENDDFDDEPFISVYHDLLKEYPGAANLPDEAASRAHIPILGKPLAHNAEGVGDSPAANSTSASELPTPEPYVWDGFTVCDYQTDKYAEATNLEEAIAIRGEKAFLEKVEPEDFSPTPEGVSKIGIASLWCQSTWSAWDEESRKVDEERAVANLHTGDVLTLGQAPDELSRSQNLMEIEDLGFGFYHNGKLLPFTPYHDYDEDLFTNEIKHLKANEWIECVIRSTTCNGGDEGDVSDDPEFCWRVYSCDVTVYKVS